MALGKAHEKQQQTLNSPNFRKNHLHHSCSFNPSVLSWNPTVTKQNKIKAELLWTWVVTLPFIPFPVHLAFQYPHSRREQRAPDGWINPGSISGNTCAFALWFLTSHLICSCLKTLTLKYSGDLFSLFSWAGMNQCYLLGLKCSLL